MGIPTCKTSCIFLPVLLALGPVFGGQSASVLLTSSGSPSTLGAGITLTAALTPAGATGKVTFYDGSTVLGISAISSGQAQVETVMLGAGTHKLSAHYSGDATYSPSNSAALLQVVHALAADGFLPAVDYPAGSGPQALAMGDFNGDGMIDLAIAAVDGIKICLGAIGGFQCESSDVTPLGANVIMAGDFDGDGILDLVALSGYNANPYFYKGHGDGTFIFSAALLSVQLPSALAIADFDGDGVLDLLITVQNTLEVFLGNGDFTFRSAGTLQTTSPQTTVVGDWNGDGLPDLAVCDSSSGVIIFQNSGAGTFAPPVTYPLPAGCGGLVAADTNGDGILDLVAMSSSVEVLTGKSDGTFNNPAQSGTLNYTGPAATGDFLGDGRLGLAFPDSGNSAVALAIRNSAGTFQPFQEYFTGSVPSSVLAADFNGDGRTDIVVLNDQDNNFSVLLGQATGANPTVAPQSVTPDTGQGYFQIFSFVFSDSAGANDLGTVTGILGNAGWTRSSCAVTYNTAQNILSLLSDSGALSGGTAPGQGNQQNSQCVLVGGQSSVSKSGKLLTLNAAVGFKNSPYCCQAIWGNAVSSTGTISGIQMLGIWRAAPLGGPPQVISVAPANGTSWGRTFTFVYQDLDGATDLSSVQAIVNSSAATASSCYISVDPVVGMMTLGDNTGATGSSGALGSNVILQNSQCTVNLAASSGVIASSQYTLRLAMTFANTYSGLKNTYGYAVSRLGPNSGWQPLGQWTVGAPSACDPTGAGTASAADVQQLINEGLGLAAPADDLDHSGEVGIVDVQLVVNAARGGVCQ